MVELIEHDYNVLTVLSRFSLPLGFGQKSIGELCDESGIHTDAFLLIINFLLTGEIDSASIMKVSPADVVYFLHNSHDYYLSYKLPHIRANLISALDDSHGDINPIIVKFLMIIPSLCVSISIMKKMSCSHMCENYPSMSIRITA